MTKRRPSFTMEGINGSVTVRAWGKGFRIKATMHNGDEAAEMVLAAHAVRLMQEIVRGVANEPDLLLSTRAIRHIDDHEKVG